jgi:hypothetical protein
MFKADLKDVPSGKVRLRVYFDNKTKAKFPSNNKIDDAEKNGIEIDLIDIISRSTRHFDDTPLINSMPDNESKNEQAKDASWHRMKLFLPHIKTRANGKNGKIVLSDGDNGDERSKVSEIMGVGAGIITAEKALGLDYSTVFKIQLNDKLKFADFGGKIAGNDFLIETRGRYKRHNRSTAINQIRKKSKKALKEQKSFIATIYYPTDTPRSSGSDVEVFDPQFEGFPFHLESDWQYRVIHYSDFLRIQGYLELASLLRYVSLNFSSRFIEDIFYQYQNPDILKRLLKRYSRTSFTHDIGEYRGTVFECKALPAWLAPNLQVFSKRSGYLFYGISTKILSDLLSFRFTSIEAKQCYSGSFWSNGYLYTFFSDGTAIIWADNLKHLITHD